MLPCDNTAGQYYAIDLEAGKTYEFEVTRDLLQCVLDPVAKLHKGDCDASNISECELIASGDDDVDRSSYCGEYGDPKFQFTATTPGKYTFIVSKYPGSLTCPDGGYKYSAKVTMVSVQPPSDIPNGG